MHYLYTRGSSDYGSCRQTDHFHLPSVPEINRPLWDAPAEILPPLVIVLFPSTVEAEHWLFTMRWLNMQDKHTAPNMKPGLSPNVKNLLSILEIVETIRLNWMSAYQSSNCTTFIWCNIEEMYPGWCWQALRSYFTIKTKSACLMQFPRPLQQVYHESLHIVNYSRLENYTSESNLTFKFKLNDFMNSHVAAVDLFPVWYEGITQMTRSLEQQVQVLQSPSHTLPKFCFKRNSY